MDPLLLVPYFMYDDIISAPKPSRQMRRKRRAAARGTTQVAADTADKAVETESNYLEEAVCLRRAGSCHPSS